jgi:hypothetical protein
MATPETTIDPFDTASNPPEQTYDLFGKVEISAWACALVKGTGKVPHDPAVHPKRFTAVDIYIEPLPEIDVKYPKTLEDHLIAEFTEWAKITLPSIKALGFDNVRDINGKYVRVARVPNGKKYERKDTNGNPTGEMRDETTFKFVALFADEDACRAAWVAAGGTPSNGSNGNGSNGHNVPLQAGTEDAEKATAYQFLKVIVGNATKGMTKETHKWADAQAAVAQAIAQYPTVAKFYTVNSMETGALITEQTNLLPF